MKSLRIKLAAIVVAVAALVVAPAAAHAYTPSGPDGGAITVAPGGSVTVPFSGFAPGETVRFTHTGESASLHTLATVTAATESISLDKTADSSGAAAVTVTLHPTATGTYTLTATGLTSGASAQASLVASTAGGGTGDVGTTAPGALPATGVDSASLMGFWIGGGVLLLGGLAVTVFAVRRQRQGV